MGARKRGLPPKTLFSVQMRASEVHRWLSPFLLSCSIYFLLWIPGDQPSWPGAVLKCLPVLYLTVFLGAVAPGHSTTLLLQGALVCSAVGDACLIWPEAFLHGLAAFAAAHLLNLWAFGLSPLQPSLLLLGLLAFAGYYSLLLPHLPPHLLLPVAAYGLTLAATLWRGLARGRSAACGILLFTLSDGLLAWDAFVQPLPYARLVIMSTYYAAQALITLSALESPGLKTH